MKVKIKFFAMMREIASKNELEIEFEKNCNVADLKKLLSEKNPKIEKWIAISRVAINEQFVQDKFKLKDGDEIAFIPPVSGG